MSADHKLQAEQKPEFTQKGEPNFNYTKTPNALVDELIAKGKLALGVECIILLVIQRNTWGADGKPEYFRASLAEMARACQVAHQSVAFALKRLETAGIIDVIPKGDLKPGEKRGYRLMPENWHKVKVYKDPNAPKPEKPKELPVGFDPDQPRVVELKPRQNQTVNIPITAKAPGEMDFPVTVLNEVDLNLAFALVLTKIGLNVIARKPAEASAPEASAKRTKSEAPSVITATHPSQITENKPSVSFNTYNSYFSKIFHDELDKPLDKLFLKKIIEAAGNAPVDYFDAPLARLRKRKLLTSGMILQVAREEVGPLWAERRKTHEAEEVRLADACPRCKGSGNHPNFVGEYCDVCHGSGKRKLEASHA
jgi:hypothetical protein